LLPVKTYVEGIRSGNRSLLSQAITLVESSLPKHQSVAQEIIEQCLPFTGNSIRIGITGVPGVGKSTFIEALGVLVTGKGHQLAVLAIDPSSERTKGSILGDKTRMEQLANDKNAFIRPSPSAGSLGGVARKTKEIIVLCEAAGFDVIFVETVGVGQSETAVHSMVDFFLLLMLAGAGDELQGIKRGIMEMADAIAINKADGDNLTKAQLAMRQYQNALHLFPPSESGWEPVVKTCSSLTNEGVAEIWEVVELYRIHTKKTGYFDRKRQEQEQRILVETIRENLKDDFFKNPVITGKLTEVREKISAGKASAYQMATHLLQTYYRSLSSK
ncbi:MAG: methylmalonyl Co-A mutase-associated GTPase MeaB, partial [Bacteroidales bacterium]